MKHTEYLWIEARFSPQRRRYTITYFKKRIGHPATLDKCVLYCTTIRRATLVFVVFEHRSSRLAVALATVLFIVKTLLTTFFTMVCGLAGASSRDGCKPSPWSFLKKKKNLTYSRWTSSLPSCLWSQRIFPSLPGSRLTIFYRDASSALSQLVNQ